MKVVFEKIIERLEEVRDERALVAEYTLDVFPDGQVSGLEHAIEIVNQVEEEFGGDINVGSNDGWIPCSERLPEVYEDTKSSGVVLVCGYDEESDYSWQAMGFYVHTEAIKRWFFAECKDTDKPIDWIDIVAWQPLPEPYKPKGEK